jgi:hypothetical protein
MSEVMSKEQAYQVIKAMERPMLIDGVKLDRLNEINAELLYCLQQIIQDLPTRRDWLDPVIEKMARAAIAKAEGEA